MKCPICGGKEWVLEQDPLSECGHDLNDIRNYIERLKSELVTERLTNAGLQSIIKSFHIPEGSK